MCQPDTDVLPAASSATSTHQCQLRTDDSCCFHSHLNTKGGFLRKALTCLHPPHSTNERFWMFSQGISEKLLPWLLTAVSSPPAALLHLSVTLAWSGGNEMHLPVGRYDAMGEVEVTLGYLGLDLWSKTCEGRRREAMNWSVSLLRCLPSKSHM